MLDRDRAITASAIGFLVGATATLSALPACAQAALDDLPVLANWKAPDNTGMVTAMAVSRDGRYVLSGYYQQSVLWDAQSGRPLNVLSGHDGNVAVAFLDGQRAATADPKKGVIVWEIPSGRKVTSWVVKNSDRLAAAADGRHVATAGFDDKSLRVWDAATGRRLWTRDGLTGWPTGLSYSPDGKLIVTGGQSSVSLWNAATGSPIAKIAMHSQVWAVAVSPDQRLVAAAEPAAIRIVDIESKQLSAEIPSLGESWFQDIAFLPNGRHVAVVDLKGDTLIAALATRQFVATSPDSAVRPQRIAISPDGSRAYVGQRDGAIQVLDLASLR